MERVTAINNRHFTELIKAYRRAGFTLVTLGEKLAELETDNLFVVIEIKK